MSRSVLHLRKSGVQAGASNERAASILFSGDFYLQAGSQVDAEILHPDLRARVGTSNLAVLNFEGAISSPGSSPIPKCGPHLKMEPRAAALAQELGFHAATLANNHSMDYGADGLKNTLRVLTAQGLQTTGAGLTCSEASRSLKVVLPGNQRVQILSFCEREFGIAQSGTAGVTWLHSPFAEDLIRQAKLASDVVIVCAHGGNEVMPLPSVQRREQLRSLVDAGADLVIGHHPHVPQGWEEWGVGTIFYSLGDFYFDSLDGHRAPHRDWGYMAQAWLEGGHIGGIDIVPFERVGTAILPLGAARDAEAHLLYLEHLASIVSSDRLPAYWQTLAIDRFLRGYAADVGGLVEWKRTVDSSFVMRLRETRRWLSDIWSLWRPQYFSNDRTPQSAPLPELQLRTLNALNLIRCESHRYAIETSLSVLAGDSEDLRTSAVLDDLQKLAPFSGYSL